MILAAAVIHTPGVQNDSERLCSSGKVIPVVLHNLAETVCLRNGLAYNPAMDFQAENHV